MKSDIRFFKRFYRTSLFICLMIICFLTIGCGKQEGAQKVQSPGIPPGFIPVITFGDEFYDVSSLNQNLWAVGYFGKIVHSGDGGKTWSAQHSGTTASLLGVSFSNDREGWVVGDRGTILHTKDGGKTWSQQDSAMPPKEKLLKVQFVNNQEGFAVGTFGTILHTSNGGAKWNRLASFKEDVILNDLSFLNGSKGWICGEFETILHTTDGGKTWKKQRGGKSGGSSLQGKLFGITFKDDVHGLAVGTVGKIILTLDGGKTWKEIKSVNGDTLLKVQFFNGLQAIAVGVRGTIVQSSNNGLTWSPLVIPHHYGWLSGVSFNKSGMGYLVGGEGKILMSKDGKTWNRLGFGPFGR